MEQVYGLLRITLLGTFGIDNNSSSPTDNFKNIFLVLGEEPTDDINDSVGAAEKSVVFILVKQRQNSVLYYNDDDSYLFVDRKKS